MNDDIGPLEVAMTTDARRLLHIAIGLCACLAILAGFLWLTGEPLLSLAMTFIVGGPIADWMVA